jgi:histidine triad (HIT) family protein
MSDSIFSRIIRGEVACHRVYEDELTIAFLDVNPVAPGHTLVVPKEPAVTLAELSDASAAALGKVLPRICRAVCKTTGATAYNILQNNGVAAHQVVDHVHFHVIPKTDSQGLGINWRPGPLDPEAGAELGRKIARLL